MRFFKSLQNMQVLSSVLSVIGLADSIYLWWTKLTHAAIMCGVGDCDLVNASPYSMLLGIPVAALGTAGYAALLIAAVWALLAKDNAPTWLTNGRIVMASGGLFFAAYLTVIEIFVIHAICIWCVLQATAMLGIFIGLMLERRLENE